jgi:phage replication O-like protein O
MANPQLEEGHTKIANEIVEKLCTVNLTSHESRILWCILRKTYGWNKKSDRISYSQFQESTGIDRRHVGRSLASLRNRNIITCTGQGYSLEYGLQKNYDLWDKFATIPGNALPPSQATNPEEICHHLGNDLPPFGDALPPSQATNLPPSQGTTKAIKHTTKALYKSKSTFGELSNIKLSPEEYQKLVDKFGMQGAFRWIDELSLAKASKGYKSKSDYATILVWERRDKNKPELLHPYKKDIVAARRPPGQVPTAEENEAYLRAKGVEL